MGTEEDLAQRVERLEARLAIQERMYDYAHAIDYGEEEAWLNCFTTDGVFDVRMRLGSRPDIRCEGREELAKFIAAHTRPPEAYHKHLLADTIVRLTGPDSAECTSYFVRVDEGGARTANVVAMGRYFDRLVRESDGIWRFVERRAELENQ